MTARQRVAVVTGGGGGIGAAVAEALGRDGWYVVTADPLVTVDGVAQLPQPEQTTAGRIVAAGGDGRASAVSVTDAAAVRALFEELVATHGALDAVINVAGISRPTGFAHGSEDDWRAVVAVHLGGYLNVLEAALPLMADAGHGRIVGVTSGSGWRPADAGAYSCAKRAVAALTWQLARHAPSGVTINAMSPIAATRMVAAALERARPTPAPEGGGATGGLSLMSMPSPDELGPLGAHLVSDQFGWAQGQVVFAGGSEVAIVEEPRLLEVVRTEGAASLDGVLRTVLPKAFAKAEAKQASAGGGNARFSGIFEEAAAGESFAGPVRACAVVSDRPSMTASITDALSRRSISCHPADPAGDFDAAARSLQAADEAGGPVDAVVVVLSAPDQSVPASSPSWQTVLAEHAGILEGIHADAAWARAVAGYSAARSRPMRLLTVTDAANTGGKSRAQASAQLARVAAGSTDGRVSAFAIAMEASNQVVGPLAAYLLADPDAPALAGAELAVGAGWLGLRSHPRPIGAVTYGGPEVPEWLDATLREVVGAR